MGADCWWHAWFFTTGDTDDVVVDSRDVEGEGVGVDDALVALELVVPVGVVLGPCEGVACEETVGAGVAVGSPESVVGRCWSDGNVG